MLYTAYRTYLISYGRIFNKTALYHPFFRFSYSNEKSIPQKSTFGDSNLPTESIKIAVALFQIPDIFSVYIHFLSNIQTNTAVVW